jgi:hypothetical protein
VSRLPRRQFRRHVLAPGDDPHAESVVDPRDLAADIAQSEDAKHLAAELRADCRVPAATSDRRGFADDVARACENECPGQFDRGGRAVSGIDDSDPALLGSGNIDAALRGPVEAINLAAASAR